MNCKQGDMATVVRSAADNEGRTVTCLEFVGAPGVVEIEDGRYIWLPDGDYWLVDTKLNVLNQFDGLIPDCVPYVRDSWLVPISGYKEPQQVKEEEGEPA
jgi:hypothetical protein